MELAYLEEAKAELREAVAWYEECSEGLGRSFFQEVQRAEDAILSLPKAWGKVGEGFRRKMLERFPYGLVYHQTEPQLIEIVAVMHLHREPGYWRRRTE